MYTRNVQVVIVQNDHSQIVATWVGTTSSILNLAFGVQQAWTRWIQHRNVLLPLDLDRLVREMQTTGEQMNLKMKWLDGEIEQYLIRRTRPLSQQAAMRLQAISMNEVVAARAACASANVKLAEVNLAHVLKQKNEATKMVRQHKMFKSPLRKKK